MEVLYRIIVNMTAQAYSGKMLVASPSMDNDEIFSKSVVYIYQQKEDLVLGLVLNKPSKLKISDVYKLKSGEPGLPMPEQVYKGGPVNDQSIILLHENNWNSTSSANVGHGLAVSSDELMLEKIITGNRPKHFRMFCGCSTWHPRQLAMECHSGSWMLIDDPREHLFFNHEGKQQWLKGIEVAGTEVMNDYF